MRVCPFLLAVPEAQIAPCAAFASWFVAGQDRLRPEPSEYISYDGALVENGSHLNSEGVLTFHWSEYRRIRGAGHEKNNYNGGTGLQKRKAHHDSKLVRHANMQTGQPKLGIR